MGNRIQRRTVYLGTIVTMVAVLGVALAATVFSFIQTSSPTTVPTSPFAGCSAPANDLSYADYSSNGVVTTAELIYDCSGPAAAFTVLTEASYVPTITLTLGTLIGGLSVVPFASLGTLGTPSGDSCSSWSGYLSLTSGTALTLQAIGYVYCADVSGSAGAAVGSFSVTWTAA